MRNLTSATMFIAMASRVFAIYPIALATGILFAASGFSLKSAMTEFFTYVSSVSQVAAESPRHVNQLVCKDKSIVIDNTEDLQLTSKPNDNSLPPKVICREMEIRSVSIDNAAEEAASVLLSAYAYLVLVSLCIELGRILFRSRTAGDDSSDRMATRKI